ncbi:unnamed protein product [Enterobius vermicularis]|uniref:Uncharacterized protein n=1 Tax=Enterobius vermicularis TaxID=51028 RepID=A0A0N4VGQ1_ENTVE|nr:unnamed protein product [Enterobius vermicularis]
MIFEKWQKGCTFYFRLAHCTSLHRIVTWRL